MNQLYYVTDPYADYVFPTFARSRIECPEAYWNEVVSPANTWITGVSDNNGDGVVVGWQTNLESNKGTYLIKITAYDALCYGTPLDVTYELVVES